MSNINMESGLNMDNKIELLRQWRDYHWREAFTAKGSFTSMRHRGMAEAFHQVILMLDGCTEFDVLPETPTRYSNLKYGEYPSDTNK